MGINVGKMTRYYSDSRFVTGEDSLSRDSGHSSAGTPELSHNPIASINRYSSYTLYTT